MIGPVQRFRDGPVAALAHLDEHGRFLEQVQRPVRPVAGGDQQRPIGLIDVADRCGPRQARPPAARRDAGDLALEVEVVADLVRRQRPRCQDLPSVWVDGAYTISTPCISRIVRAPSAAID